MKNKRVVSLLIAVILMITLLPATPVSAKAKTKLSAKSITMTVGDTKTIKLLNSKKGAVWSRENEHIKILSETKKQVKIKAIEDGTSKVYANVGKKEYICKIIIKKKKFPKNTATPKPTIEPAIATTDKPIPTVTPTPKPVVTPKPIITPNSNSFNSSEAEKNVKKEVRIINNKIVVFLENNYSMPVSIQSDCYFYDEKENVVDTGYSYLFQIEPNMKGALIFNETKEEYSSYELKYDFFQSFAYINNKSILGDIKLKSNDIISDGEVSGIALTIMNQSNFDCSCCTFLVNFYDDFGNIVDTKMETEYDIKRKEKEVAEITLPYNSRTYENIKYSSYEILLSTAYY